MARNNIKKLIIPGLNLGVPASQNAELSTYQLLSALDYKINECIDEINSLVKLDPVEKTSAMTEPVGIDDDGKLWAQPADLTEINNNISALYGITEVQGNAIVSLGTSKQNKRIERTLTLPILSWVNNQVTVTVQGITESNLIDVSPAVDSYDKYGENGVRCIAQATNTLTFACLSEPDVDLSVNVVIWN